MKPTDIITVCCIIIPAILVSDAFAKRRFYPYKKCRPAGLFHHQLWLVKGKCSANSNCDHLMNCTTLHGSIVVRATFDRNAKPLYDASFPALREITGYLIIIYLRDLHSLSNIFPNLAVIRGEKQVVHYSLVIYNTLLEKVILPSLTVIKSGGVRIDHNDQMCYVDTIRWRSIVLERALTEENFGIAFYKNNENCYNKCLIGHCYAPSGHHSARQQHCFGPGNTDNAECQKLCKTSCGIQGCVDGTVDQCCHEECLGGCTRKGSNRHCHACMHYRAGKYGFCVSRCPEQTYAVENFECLSYCPGWGYWHLNLPGKYYHHNGNCVRPCPAGYTANAVTKSCDKCITNVCPRECGYRGMNIKIDGLSAATEFAGCTVLNGNIKIELRAGPSDIIKKLTQYLGSVQQLNGYIEVRESEALVSLEFFKSLRRIEPITLLKDDFAVLVFRNSNLKTLWKPKTLHIGKGRLLFHSNPYLCKSEIKALEKTLVVNKTQAITEAKNGYLGACDVRKFNITVTEVTNARACRSDKFKCVNVTWYHERTIIDSRSSLFIVNFRMISNDTDHSKKQLMEDTCGSVKWMKEDVSVPKTNPKVNSTEDSIKAIKMFKVIPYLVPYAVYAFFVETYVLDGEGRKSDMVYLRLSASAPGRPLGLRASYLSHSELEVTWKPPDNPNGIIIEYRIYFERKNYSFWKSGLDWCSRDVTPFSAKRIEETQETTSTVVDNGVCRTNVSCNCEGSVKESRRIIEDRNFALFNRDFEDEIIKKIFVKPRDKDDDEEDDEDEDDDKKKGKTISSKSSLKKKKKKLPIGRIKSSDTKGDTGKLLKKSTTTAKPRTSTTPRTSTSRSSAKWNATRPKLTPRPPKEYFSVDGKTFKFVIKNLSHFQEYKIKVCPCNNVSCRATSYVCASTFGQTDVDPVADRIPGRVVVSVIDNAYNVSWTAPPRPNGIVLRYDIRTKHNQNQERLRCRLGHLPTTVIETGAAPGNYSIKIRAITPASNGSWTPYTIFTIEEKPISATTKTNTVIIGIGSAAAFLIFLMALTIIYCTYIRKTAQMGVPGVLYASVNPEYLNSNEVYIPDEWEVPRDKIELIKELGKGSFGMVYEGIGYDIVEEEPKLRVAVKTVNENASIRDRIEFLQEASIMKAFNCNHIVRLLGVVSQGQPTLVVMELMERGDLKSFLRNRRPEERGGRMPPSLAEVLQMAAEIADGMSYLAARKFVHRDLAARNCMVTADFTVKIGDFGMTRDVYETDYYRKGGKGLLPVRWMAPESLRDGIFTTASDVWSYGVVLWEMATLAAQPYPGKSNEDVLRFVVDGGILEQPDDCSDRLYNMMCNCWKTDPRARPSFLEVVQFLENDVSETFEKVSYYHEMKRKLLEATETNLLKGPDQVNASQVRRGSLKMAPNLADHNSRDSVSSESDGNWKTEVDPFVKENRQSAQERSNSLYDNDGDGTNMRYVDLPNAKQKKNGGKPVAV